MNARRIVDSTGLKTKLEEQQDAEIGEVNVQDRRNNHKASIR